MELKTTRDQAFKLRNDLKNRDKLISKMIRIAKYQEA